MYDRIEGSGGGECAGGCHYKMSYPSSGVGKSPYPKLHVSSFGGRYGAPSIVFFNFLHQFSYNPD
jgi:hypothetical protein